MNMCAKNCDSRQVVGSPREWNPGIRNLGVATCSQCSKGMTSNQHAPKVAQGEVGGRELFHASLWYSLPLSPWPPPLRGTLAVGVEQGPGCFLLGKPLLLLRSMEGTHVSSFLESSSLGPYSKHCPIRKAKHISSVCMLLFNYLLKCFYFPKKLFFFPPLSLGGHTDLHLKVPSQETQPATGSLDKLLSFSEPQFPQL